MRYSVVWSGRIAKECTTSIMEFMDKEHWGNYMFIKLHVVDRELQRIVHVIDVPINETCGWPPDDAFVKIGALMYELERLLDFYKIKIDSGEVTLNDINL